MHKKIFLIVISAIIAGFALVTFVRLPEPGDSPDFSENENRFLARFPELNLSTIRTRRFMNGFDDWFADRFAGRENLIILQNRVQELGGITDINGVYNIGDMLVFAWTPPNDYAEIDRALADINGFAEILRDEYNAERYFMLIPSAQEIYSSRLPPNAPAGNESAFIRHCYDRVPNAAAIDAATYLAENSERYLYYRTDHHWTARGAYWGYFAAARRLGLTPYGEEAFTVEHAAADFRGTAFSRVLDYRVTPDIISFYTLAENPPQFTVRLNDGIRVTEHDGLFFREFLQKKDKHAAFLGQEPVHPVVDIFREPDESGEFTADRKRSLLILKDSFSHSLAPFVALHYDRVTLVDMRLISTDVSAVVDLNDYAQVLFMYTVPFFTGKTELLIRGLR